MQCRCFVSVCLCVDLLMRVGCFFPECRGPSVSSQSDKYSSVCVCVWCSLVCEGFQVSDRPLRLTPDLPAAHTLTLTDVLLQSASTGLCLWIHLFVYSLLFSPNLHRVCVCVCPWVCARVPRSPTCLWGSRWIRDRVDIPSFGAAAQWTNWAFKRFIGGELTVDEPKVTN